MVQNLVNRKHLAIILGPLGLKLVIANPMEDSKKKGAIQEQFRLITTGIYEKNSICSAVHIHHCIHLISASIHRSLLSL